MANGLPAYKKIVIGFSRRKSPFSILSKIIMLIEKRAYSHAYIRLQEPVTAEDLIFQASVSMVNFFYHEQFKQHNIIVEEYEIAINSSLYYQIWAYAIRKMGSDYGYLELLTIFAGKLFKIRSWFINGDKTNICSELAARICAMCGIRLGQEPDTVTPSDLNKIINQVLNNSNIRLITIEKK